jgi:hypothetical protein
MRSRKSSVAESSSAYFGANQVMKNKQNDEKSGLLGKNFLNRF